MIFIDNKYTRWYNQIISTASNRVTPDCYTERHHIIPKSLGGGNNIENLVVLTAREHFICHWLLPKMTIGLNNSKMWFALHGLRRCSKYQSRYATAITSRIYEAARVVMAARMSEMNKGMVGPNLGKPMLEETKQKLRDKIVTEETRQKIRDARAKQDTSHLKGRIITLEWREKLSVANLGKTRSSASIEKQRLTMIGKKRPTRSDEWIENQRASIISHRKTCEYCGKDVTKSAYTRCHGHKCKLA